MVHFLNLILFLVIWSINFLTLYIYDNYIRYSNNGKGNPEWCNMPRKFNIAISGFNNE